MLTRRWKGSCCFAQLVVVVLAAAAMAGCGDAASKASEQQPPALSVLGIFPADGAVSVPTNTAITAAFNQEIDTATFTDATFILRGNSKAITGTPSYKNRQAQFTPSAELAANTEYSVEMTAEIKSRSGQALDKSVTWKFVTGPASDSTAPSVVDTQPAANATNVPINSKIIALFSERINVAAVSDANFSVKRGDTVVAGVVQASESALSFSPSATFVEAATYTVSVQGVVDLAGNALAAAKTWSFTVGKAPDTDAPALLSSSPASGTDNLPAVFAVTLQFSEPLDTSTITPNTISFAAGNGVAVFTATRYLSASNSVVVTPQKDLSYGATYTLKLDGVTDAAGNRLVPVTLSFKTELDTDGDLMPDRWEKLKGTDPAIADGTADPDLDKLTNLEEFRHGTDPKNPDSDGDGTSDGDEVRQGRNPLVNEPVLLTIINSLMLSD